MGSKKKLEKQILFSTTSTNIKYDESRWKPEKENLAAAVKAATHDIRNCQTTHHRTNTQNLIKRNRVLHMSWSFTQYFRCFFFFFLPWQSKRKQTATHDIHHDIRYMFEYICSARERHAQEKNRLFRRSRICVHFDWMMCFSVDEISGFVPPSACDALTMLPLFSLFRSISNLMYNHRQHQIAESTHINQHAK